MSEEKIIGSLVPLSVIIPTRNEERNLRPTLESVKNWADQIVVFDSFSNDRTLEITREFGVDVVQRKFDNFSTHKNWALDNLSIRNPWILFLDADERLTPELRREIGQVVVDEGGQNGYYIARNNYFMGHRIRHCAMYPDWQLRLFRRGKGRYEERIVHEHILIEGLAGYLKNPLEHNDLKGLERWLDRHNAYTSMEALEVRRVLGRNHSQRIPAKLTSRGPERTRVFKEWAYRYLPFRALFVFTWMYLLRGGFLDGRIGFRYCALRAFVDYQISLKVLEMREGEEALTAEQANQRSSVNSTA
jgi:glycosyltransferase involved in cell wall biosynthesis